MDGTNYEGIAQALWAILDDIDTADDIAKSDDVAYRRMVRNLHRKRWAYGNSDGYTVTLKTEPTS